jgi:hypothetical protein
MAQRACIRWTVADPPDGRKGKRMGKMHRALNVFVNNLSAGFTFKMSLSHVIFRGV